MSQPLVQLDYEPARPKRRRWVRWTIFAIVILAASLACMKWVPRFWHRWVFLRAQERCLNYTAPADQVVYDTDPGRQKALIARPGYVVQNWSGIGTTVGHVPQCWLDFNGYGNGGPLAFAFLHERTSPDGTRRLVAVEVTCPPSLARSRLLAVRPHIAPESTWLTDGRWLTTAQYSLEFRRSPRVVSALRVLAGQPDPTDPSHLTIRFLDDGPNPPGVVHVWLRNGDQIQCRIEDDTPH